MAPHRSQALACACACAPLLLLLLALAPGGAAAQRSSCPSAVCNSYFANAVGGPVDCCSHDYAKSSRCVWGGSPVSFTQARTCEDAARPYKVLQQNNFQGPPGANECRCANPDAPAPGGAARALTMCVELKPRANTDIAGQDVACGGQPFCKVCGGADAVRGACQAAANCVAFTFSAAEGCGYLKTGAANARGRSGWVAYMR